VPPDDHVFDRGREARIGLPEAIFCAHKTPAQIAASVRDALERDEPRLFTRLDPAQLAALPADLADELAYDPLSRTATVGPVPPPRGPARVAIVTAGTSDASVATEAVRTLNFSGEPAELHLDLGVAGLWRLLDRLDRLASFPVLIAVAGMEGSLFNVLGGLVPGVLIAVPAPTGYGVAAGGAAALASALGGCAPGLLTVNTGNGYGAACAALRVLRAMDAARVGA
jgi:NCAIR mutase (PurE)-related protein